MAGELCGSAGLRSLPRRRHLPTPSAARLDVAPASVAPQLASSIATLTPLLATRCRICHGEKGHQTAGAAAWGHGQRGNLWGSEGSEPILLHGHWHRDGSLLPSSWRREEGECRSLPGVVGGLRVAVSSGGGGGLSRGSKWEGEKREKANLLMYPI
jgi:hypothetical protein